ncbi:MAG: hypothetical protein QOH71_3156 [Blastocatellia bacterium]|jgi:hypothetical protein|nr:hypothetical protein [Blastocatellia bacterium]
MKMIRARYYRFALAIMCGLAASILPSLTFATSPALAGDKITTDEVVAKHLEAIGPAAARSSEHSRIAVGAAHAIFKVRNSSGALDGRAVFGSVDRKVMLGLGFSSPNYPGEKFGFDGKKFTVGYLTPGVRSSLGNFLVANDAIFKEGLMGGTLSSAWPLLNLKDRAAKVEYGGTDKIEGQLVHKLKYSPKKGSDVNITLYFDATTFQHVRTQYDFVISSRLSAGGIDNQARQQETRYKMIENFSDYKKEGELNLPHSYTLQLEISRTNGSSQDKWEVKLEQFAFNQEIDAKTFNVEGD